ncbi:MAG: VWA domain-containing protein, partial [Gammaproteobacteria bacterium]|nr:VWA domain-containing protein [Gammaproteobacteria bacterium]
LNLAQLRNTISEIDDELAVTQGLARRVQDDLDEALAALEESSTATSPDELDQLKRQLRELEQQKQLLKAEIDARGDAVRQRAGIGRQAYLTGLQLDGSRTLILLDSSASMLDDTIVNVIRRRNMSDDVKRRSPKWRQALATVDWLTARLRPGSRYQLWRFSTDAGPVQGGVSRDWLSADDGAGLNKAVQAARRLVPAGGTSLSNTFRAIRAMQPQPDSIVLITDGLPTQGSSARGNTVSGRERLKLFDDAIKELSGRIPVNTVLLPMEGDPMAASAFWQLAQLTRGSLVSPTEDWP